MYSFNGTGSQFLSGVEYFTGGSATYTNTVDNLYRNTYYTGSDALVYNVTSLQAISSESLGTCSGDEAKAVVITKTVNIPTSATRLVNGSITVTTTAKRTVQSQQTSTGASVNNILLDNFTATSTISAEGFDDEHYRLLSSSNFDDYTTGATGSWDSTVTLVDSGSYPDALQVTNSQLIYPSTNYSALAHGPAGNVNYSAGVSGARTYYRFFNMAPTGRSNFTLAVNGTATPRAAGYAMTNGTNDIKIDIKLPNSGGEGTGWLDVTQIAVPGNLADGDGCLNGGTFTMNVGNGVNVDTKNTGSLSVNGIVFIRIRVPQAWTGNLTSLSLVGV